MNTGETQKLVWLNDTRALMHKEWKKKKLTRFQLAQMSFGPACIDVIESQNNSKQWKKRKEVDEYWSANTQELG